MTQALASSQPLLAHRALGDGFRLCLLAPYLATIINPKGERQCTYVGFDDYAVAKSWFSQIQHRAILRRAKHLSTSYEIKIWGLSTSQVMSLWRQVNSHYQQTALLARRANDKNAAKSLSVKAATKLIGNLENSQAITNQSLSHIMTECASLSDAQGGWDWKDAYDAIEAAIVMYVRTHGKTLLSQSSPLAALAHLASLCPTHTQ